ncbi:proton-conducting transporter membrane subunit [Cocleimonas flava]|uniref:Multisubunit sodium/proton antiporter MrpD subunit n=1 Tax=Cocleimonas flava TaxID=634765 RepID=A0A4R1EXD0_9GAMM|nr:monovalent cation/H+ antiporter subunit D family protein [Cocleimonas flava]TCJ84509.1 multisubunit sodium/proton antiporter MrpD subunit [Cocleimonas flava]
MMGLTPNDLIVLALCIPLFTAAGIFLADKNPNVREGITLVGSVLLFITIVALTPHILDGERPNLKLIEILPGLEISFTVEPLGMIFALVAATLWPINSLYSIGYMRTNNERKQTRFYIFFAIALSSVMAIAFAGNLLTLFIFYEVLTLSTYPLVTHAGTEKARNAGRVYLGILISTSIGLLLPAIIWVWYAAGTTDFKAGGILTGQISGPLLTLLAALFIFGIGKAAVMPTHRWLPAAMVAPTPVSALLHAVAVVKAGVFSVVKVVAYIFGLDLLATAPGIEWLLYIACFTVVAASIVALQQDNLKKRLAYSTISQLSYVVMGAMILAPLSLIGAALHIAVHAFGKITLFFAAGSIYTASKKTNVSQLNGIGRRMPWTMTAFSIGALSMIALPPAAGFLSKWYLLLGASQQQQYIAMAVIVMSTLLNAAYFVPVIYAAFLKTEDPVQERDHKEAPLPMVVALTMTAAATLLLFLFPGLALELAKAVGVPV